MFRTYYGSAKLINLTEETDGAVDEDGNNEILNVVGVEAAELDAHIEADAFFVVGPRQRWHLSPAFGRPVVMVRAEPHRRVPHLHDGPLIVVEGEVVESLALHVEVHRIRRELRHEEPQITRLPQNSICSVSF